MDPEISGWLAGGSELLLTEAAALGDPGALSEPSLLPGWSRAHLLTHLARNADALGNLLIWARTGVETPMYCDAAQRVDDIEAGAGRPVPEILADLATSTARLDDRISHLPADAWPATVTTAQGRHIAASTVPWLRVREVWIHAIDLGTGIGFEDLPHALALRLLGEVTGSFKTRPCPAVTVRPTDADTRFTTRLDESDAGPTATGTTAELLRWATGRGGPDLPTLPVWL
jgi:maleylpyruvate isomerase